MGYQEELQRLVGAKESMRQSIIAKGVDVPESAKIEEYREYIAQITGGGSVPDAPDLSKVLTKQDLDDIQAIVKAGKASEKFNLGDEFLISYGTYTMPFEVVGFEDVEVEGGETVPAINLLAKYASEYNTNSEVSWGGSGNTAYSASTLRSSITTYYQNQLSADFVECLANTKTQTYSRDGSTDVVYDKLFAPSMQNLGVTATGYNNASQAAVEGPTFSEYAGSDNNKRIRNAVDRTTSPQAYWTRSLYVSNSSQFGCIRSTGAPSADSAYTAHRIVVACNLIGESPVAPASLSELKEAIDAGKEIKIGTEIPDTYNGNDNPLVVAQKLDSSNNSAYGNAEGIILVRKYVEPASQAFGSSADYTTSSVKTLLEGTYYNNCSDELKSLMSDIQIQATTSTITAKLFLMSDYEVCSNLRSSTEGEMWAYWKQQTGLSSPSSAANSGRILKDRSGAALETWLRSRTGSSACFVTTAGAISSGTPSAQRGVLPACFIAKT